MALGLEADNDLAAGGVLLRVVKQDIYDLPQGLGVARDPQTVCDLIAQAQAPLIKRASKGSIRVWISWLRFKGVRAGRWLPLSDRARVSSCSTRARICRAMVRNAGCRVGGAVPGAGRTLQRLLRS